MQFMVIEYFRDQNAAPVYARFGEKGRLMPHGVTYVSSWVAADLSRCFQVMETDDASFLHEWVAAWGDLVEFEIVPVATGAQTAQILMDPDGQPT